MNSNDSNSPAPDLRTAFHWAVSYFQQAPTKIVRGWDWFWFTPRSAYWLSLLRIAVGLMLLYTHLVWTLGFDQFLGPDRMVPDQFGSQFNPSLWYWSHFDWVQNIQLLWAIHWLAILIFICFTIGLAMPWTGWLATVFAISYAHRATGALFGLDQMNVALVTYLSLGGAGRYFSVDRWLLLRKQNQAASDQQGRAVSTLQPPVILQDHSTLTNIATRLLQIQLCIIYWFAGTGKLQGISWWNGEAMWGAMASYQYQSIDMTWLHAYPSLLALLTHITIIWEVTYVCLVWPRWSRPLVIGTAVLVHLGIGLFLGMMTFGLIMVIANLAFIEWDGLFKASESQD